MKKTDTETLSKALFTLADQIQLNGGTHSIAMLRESAQRLLEQDRSQTRLTDQHHRVPLKLIEQGEEIRFLKKVVRNLRSAVAKLKAEKAVEK